MTRIETPVDPLTELAFEIEHFEWTAADRLEVSGRWLGVRGQRFVRPTLHLRVDGRRRRLIALLDHKPWAADTEELWTAAFAWRGERGDITAVRLEVSTEIVLDLPAPGAELPAAPLSPRPRPKREPSRPQAPRRTPEPPPAAAVVEPPAPPAAVEPPPPAASVVDSPPPSQPATELPPPATATVESPPPLPAASAATAPPATVPEARPGPAVSPAVDAPRSAGAPDSSTVQDAPIVEIDPPAVPAHAPSTVTAQIASLALERRLVEERAEREVLARDLAEARQRIEALSSHHESAVARAQEIVDLEGQLAVANARADAAQAHVARLERELARVTAAEVAPLPPRTPRRRGEPEWDRRTNVTAIAAVAVALLVVLIILISIL